MYLLSPPVAHADCHWGVSAEPNCIVTLSAPDAPALATVAFPSAVNPTPNSTVNPLGRSSSGISRTAWIISSAIRVTTVRAWATDALARAATLPDTDVCSEFAAGQNQHHEAAALLKEAAELASNTGSDGVLHWAAQARERLEPA